MTLGFQLDPSALAEQIAADLTKPGWHLSTSLETYARPDFKTGMVVVHDAVDRAVVVFVGSREEAGAVMDAARLALGDVA